MRGKVGVAAGVYRLPAWTDSCCVWPSTSGANQRGTLPASSCRLTASCAAALMVRNGGDKKTNKKKNTLVTLWVLDFPGD